MPAQLWTKPAVTEPGTFDDGYAEVTFETDIGFVEIARITDGEVFAAIAFDDVPAERFESVLDDVADHEEFPEAAENVARDLLTELKKQEREQEDPER